MLYVGLNLREIIPFVAGINLMYRAIGIEGGYGLVYGQVMRERGWEFSGRSTWDVLKEGGLEDLAVLRELIDIEIEVLRRANGLPG